MYQFFSFTFTKELVGKGFLVSLTLSAPIHDEHLLLVMGGHRLLVTAVTQNQNISLSPYWGEAEVLVTFVTWLQ